MPPTLTRTVIVPEGSTMTTDDYTSFLLESYELLRRHPIYFTPDEGPDVLELAHLLPHVPETLLTIYLSINDAVCNKGLIGKILLNHAHNNVFVFDPDIWPGGNDVPSGTVDVKTIIHTFEPPNDSWNTAWTYVMAHDPTRTPHSLFTEKGYIDMIPAKFEDFTMMSDHNKSKLCIWIDPAAFEHDVNASRDYLKAARDRGQKHAGEFSFPQAMAGENKGLDPVILQQGEKLYVARPDFGACAHCWSSIHPDTQEMAVVNENSAVPLNLVIEKPPVPDKYAKNLVPPRGSADFTTDWFLRGNQAVRTPVLAGQIKG